jgi:hypothetical protein
MLIALPACRSVPARMLTVSSRPGPSPSAGGIIMYARFRYPLLALAATGLLSLPAAPPASAQRSEPPPASIPPEQPPPTIAPPRTQSTVKRIPSARPSRRGIIRRRRAQEGVEGGSRGRSGVEGEIRIGDVVRSELDRSDRRADGRTHYEDWVFRGEPGTRVTLHMTSSEVDPLLLWGRVVDGKFYALAANDDGGEELDSRLTVWIRDGGEYVIRANSYEPGTGRFRLVVEEAEPRPDPETARGVLEPGQTVRGELGPGDAVQPRGTYYEVWRFRGGADQLVTFTLASDDFDARLVWARVVGGELVGMDGDDDGGEGSDSELSVRVPEEGEYALIVSTVGAAQAGAYTLRARRGERGGYSMRTHR